MRKIFISSTFRDMQAERDAIHTVVLPKLRAKTQKYSEDVEVCDLRWGVNTGDLDSESGSQKVLSVCLDEIDKCKPFMLVMLGERYGWIPEPELLKSAADRKNYKLEEMEKSVTALEIEYGALDDPEVLGRSIFMFREPMPDADADYRSEGEAYAQKLEHLKGRIRKMAGERVFSYRLGWDREHHCPTELEHFTDIVAEKLQELMEEEWKENAKLSEQQKEEKRHWNFADAKAEQFGGRDKLINECREILEKDAARLLIMGEAGSGKSTLCCKLLSDYRKEGWNVYPFICGNSGMSMSATDILRQWIYYVEDLTGTEHFEEEGQNVHNGDTVSAENMMGQNRTEAEWKERFIEVLSIYCQKEGNPPLLLAADGLDQLEQDEASENFAYLPVFQKGKVRILLSCLADYLTGHYEGEKIYVQSMILQEKEEVLQGMLDYQRKGLDQKVVQEVLQKVNAENPLYLSLLLQRLLMMDRDDFAVIAEYGNDMAAINRYQTELVANAPDDIRSMCTALIKETGERVNPVLVQKMVEYLAVSRHGLREADLSALLEKENIAWSSLDFSRVIHYMPLLFVEGRNGQIDFTHRIIREGLRSQADMPKVQRRIFEYLKELPLKDELRSDEMAYYCYELDKKQYMVEYIVQAESALDDKMAKRAAEELYRISMQDQGDWFSKILECRSAYENGRNMYYFTLIMDECFVRETMAELAVQLCIFQDISGILRCLYEEQGTLESAMDYGLSCARVGEIYESRGELDAALEKYEEYLRISKKLFKEQGTPESARAYSFSCAKVGGIYENREELDVAFEKYEEALRISSKLYEEQGTPESATYILSCANFGRIHERCGYRDSVLRYEEYFKISSKLYEEQGTPESARAYSISCYSFGKIYELFENREAALEKYEEYLRISKKLYEEQGTPESARAYILSCARVGEIYEERKDLKVALEEYKEYLKLSKKLYEEQGTPESARAYSFSCAKVGRIYEEIGGLEAALEKYEEALRISSKLYEEQGTPISAMDCSISCMGAGRIYEEIGELESALEKYEEYLRISKKLYEEQYTTPQSVWDYMDSCKRVGRIYEEIGELESALEKYEEYLRINKKLYEEQGISKTSWEYSSTCKKVGRIYEEIGELESALEKYEEGLQINKKLYEEQETPKTAMDYSLSCERVGRIYEEIGELEAALEKYEESLRINKKLYEEQVTPINAREYSISCNKVGVIYKAISKKLYEEQGTPESTRAYSISGTDVGRIYEDIRELEAALEKYEDDLRISKKLYEEQGTPESTKAYSISSTKVGVIYKAISKKLYEEQELLQSARDYSISSNDVGEIYYDPRGDLEGNVDLEKLKEADKQRRELNYIDIFINIFNDAIQKEYKGKVSSIPHSYTLNTLTDKQLGNILKYCAKDIKKEDIIVFCGTKLFNNGKRGFVFTNRGIYADDSVNKNIKGEKNSFPLLYSEIKRVEYDEQYPNHIKYYWNNNNYKYLYTDVYSQFFCEVINRIVKIYIEE